MHGDSDLLKNLMQTICPTCGRKKTSEQSLCRVCFFSLSRLDRFSLYNRFGNGYERALANAYLKITGHQLVVDGRHGYSEVS